MKILIGSVFILSLLFGFPALAQPNTGDPIKPQYPIDGGASLLAAAGLAYGAKKIVDKRKEQKADRNNPS